MVSFPPCKINLGLDVVAKRTDGYHDLETCFYPVPWTDVLEVIKADTFHFTYSGNTIPGNDSDNLCIKAYDLLKRDFEVGPVKIHLHKIIPTGAGLGGGSADAAHTLRLLNALFTLGLSDEKLMVYAAILGSDCSFFIQDQPMYGTGRGEVLSSVPVSLAGKFLVLVKPPIHVSTAEAFGGIRPRKPEHPLLKTLAGPLESWRHHLKNDFEETVFKKHPALEPIKKTLYARGATYASMSGSGSTVFAIFDTEVEVKHEFPEATVWQDWIT